jgi:transcriptional regulator
MHPDRRFAWDDEQAMLDFIATRPFCTLFVDRGGESAVFHVPVVVDGSGSIRFHVSRANRGSTLLDGGRLILSCAGPDAYISPDWYGTADQVPTWNYVAVEAEGDLTCLSESELVKLLDDLTAVQEARLAPKPPWSRGKMSPGRFEAMLKAIVAYELRIDALRGTRKLGQNKSRDAIAGAISGLRDAGHAEIAELMQACSSPSETGRAPITHSRGEE